MVSIAQATTDANGWTMQVNTLQGLPATPNQQLMVMFVRATKPGGNLLAGISTRRLISFHVNLHALWSALAAFGFRMNVAALIIAYAISYALTRRSAPLGGAALTETFLPLTLWDSCSPLPSATELAGCLVNRRRFHLWEFAVTVYRRDCGYNVFRCIIFLST